MAKTKEHRIKSFFKRAALCFVTLLLMLLVVEWIVRLVAPQLLATPLLDYHQGIPTNRADIRGRQSTPGLFDVRYETNSQRFRARRDYASKPNPGTVRIAAMGDSFTFGCGANYEQCFPTIVEGELVKAGVPVEVLNCGVGGTGLGMQARWYDAWVKDFHPDVLLLTVFVNDIEDDFVDPAFEQGPGGAWLPITTEVLEARTAKVTKARQFTSRIPGYSYLAAHSHLLNIVRHIGSKALSRSPGGDNRLSRERWHEMFEKEGIPRARAELEWLHRRTSEQGTRLVIAWFPTREFIYPDIGEDAEDSRWQGERLLGLLKEFCGKTGVPLIEPTAQFKAAAAGRSEELYFKKTDRHPRPEGYRLFAEQVRASLISTRILENPSNKEREHRGGY